MFRNVKTEYIEHLMDKYELHGELVFIGVREPSGVALGDAVLDLMGSMSVLSTLVVLFFGLGAVIAHEPFSHMSVAPTYRWSSV